MLAGKIAVDIDPGLVIHTFKFNCDSFVSILVRHEKQFTILIFPFGIIPDSAIAVFF
ncbi:hypothetical protein D3C75_1161460 [compost metagenome]